MPFAKCPVCGKHTYLHVADARGWYAEHFPSLEPGSSVPWKCPECEQQSLRGATKHKSSPEAGLTGEDALLAPFDGPSQRATEATPGERSAELTVDEITALRAIAEGPQESTQETFLQWLVRHLAAGLGVSYAFVAEFAGVNTPVRTLAYWALDRIGENFEFDLAGTPCEDVVRGSLCHHPYGVSLDFPHDRRLRDLGIESYLGVPLCDGAGKVIGHLAAFDQQPMSAEPRRLFVFRVFAARAAAELVRRQAEECVQAIEQERARLQQRVLDLEARIRATPTLPPT
jgi:hypothetical protein